jgi:hypothetical protein
MSLDETALPGNGMLSGMVLTWGTAIVVLAAGLGSEEVRAGFDRPLAPAVLDGFGLTILFMLIHKVESYLTGEFDQCPVYLTAARASWATDVRRVNFVVFVGTLLTMMTVLYLVLLGGHWPLLLLAIWLAQGQHEWHHAAKSLAQRSYYPGTVTGLLFVASVQGLFFPAWAEAVGLGSGWRLAYVAVQPLIFLCFYLEHRAWLRRVEGVGGLHVLRNWRPA